MRRGCFLKVHPLFNPTTVFYPPQAPNVLYSTADRGTRSRTALFSAVCCPPLDGFGLTYLRQRAIVCKTSSESSAMVNVGISNALGSDSNSSILVAPPHFFVINSALAISMPCTTLAIATHGEVRIVRGEGRQRLMEPITHLLDES